MYFRANLKKKPRKTQGPFENPRKTQGPQKKTQEPNIASKNPRSWEKAQAVATLRLALGWFPNLTRAYDNNGRCPRQKFVFGILQLIKTRLCNL